MISAWNQQPIGLVVSNIPYINNSESWREMNFQCLSSEALTADICSSCLRICFPNDLSVLRVSIHLCGSAVWLTDRQNDMDSSKSHPLVLRSDRELLKSAAGLVLNERRRDRKKEKSAQGSMMNFSSGRWMPRRTLVCDIITAWHSK